ncbi:MAG TPA: hypothetical protein VN736_28790 [Candidatus Limnocylindrales bacterium]|nr:hypothetical protein [Candidatus Limnocylindrales bacterium]
MSEFAGRMRKCRKCGEPELHRPDVTAFEHTNCDAARLTRLAKQHAELKSVLIDWTKAKIRENELLCADDWSKIPREEFRQRQLEVANASVPLLRLGMQLMPKPAEERV